MYFVGKSVYAHRLVAETFIPNTENKPCVDHINTVKTDNRVLNLRWVTYSENMKNELTAYNNSMAQSKPVVQLSSTGEYLCEYANAELASMAIGTKRTNVWNAICGRSKTACGYVFVLKEEYDQSKDYSVIYIKKSSKYEKVPSRKAVVQINNKEILRVFSGCVEAAKFFGVSRSYITAICRGEKIGRKFNICYFCNLSQTDKKVALEFYKRALTGGR